MNWWQWLRGQGGAKENREQAIRAIQSAFLSREDWKTLTLPVGDSGHSVTLVYLEHTVDQTMLRTEIIQKLLSGTVEHPTELNWTTREWVRVDQTRDLQQRLVDGAVLLLVAGQLDVCLIQVARTVGRAIEQPEMEFVSRGPREAFTEDGTQNILLIQKRLRTARLEIRKFEVGEITRTSVWLLSVREITRTELIAEVSDMVDRVRSDGIVDSGELEEWLEASAWTPFSTLDTTERPDRAAAALLEGQIILIVHGTPMALIGPMTFFHQFHTASDYYERSLFASIKRILRLVGFFISTNLVAMYVALVGYHSHLIPIDLVSILGMKRELVPFPPFFEILIIQMMIDLVLEGILRLPAKLGQIIGVSGAIIIGQATISANLISPMVIIIVAISTIAGYGQARLTTTFTVQVIRTVNVFFAGLFGAFGLMVVWMFWLIHVCGLTSFGKAYFTPVSPLHWRDWKDTFIRVHKPLMQQQPVHAGTVHPNKTSERWE